MLFSSWLRNCKSSLDRRAELRRTRRAGAEGRTVSRLFLERLEDRCLLSAQIFNYNPTFVPESTVPSVNSVPDAITPGSDGNVWFTEANTANIGQITPSGVVNQILDPGGINDVVPGGFGRSIITGPNGDLWFSANSEVNNPPNPEAVEMTTTGQVVQTVGLPPGTLPNFAVGPHNNLWFTEYRNDEISYITPDGHVHQPFTISFPAYDIIPDNAGGFWIDSSGASGPGQSNMLAHITPNSTDSAITESDYTYAGHGIFRGLALDSNGNLWVGEPGASFFYGQGTGQIDKIDPSTGTMTGSFLTPTPNSQPYSLVAGPDGAVWFTEGNANQIGRITPDGIITEFPAPTPNSGVGGITLGPDGNLWFTEENANQIGEVVLYNQNQQDQTQPPVTQIAIPGISQNINLGTFTDDSGTGPWNVLVDWDDGVQTPDTTSFTDSSTGAVATQAQEAHTYANQGVYTVNETITDSLGSKATTQFQVVVGPLVVNTNNSGPGSLSEAIQEADDYPSLTNNGTTQAHITFAIPTSDPGYHAPAASVGITSVSVSNNVATLTTSSPLPPFTVGQTVTVAGLTDSSFDGDYQVTAVTANSFSYSLVHADLTSTADTGTANPDWFTINTKGLPAITQPVLLDGYSQSGSRANSNPMGGADPSDNAVRKIVLDGSQAPSTYTNGLLPITGANSTIQGLVIENAPSTAIGITGSGATGNWIEGNYIDGKGDGVSISGGSNNTIGYNNAISDPDPNARRNIIGGRIGVGIGQNAPTTISSETLADQLNSGTIPCVVATGTIDQADMSDQTFPANGDWPYNNPVPRVPGYFAWSNYAFVATGTLQVNTTGYYTFDIGSDDGSRLRLVDPVGNTVKVVDEPYPEGFTDHQGTVYLTANTQYTIQWTGYQVTGAAGFELSVADGSGISGPVTAANGWHLLGDANNPDSNISLQGPLAVTVSYAVPSGGQNNVVAGNYIGIDATGKAVIPGLGYYGAGLSNGGNGNTIGGSTAAARNVIAGWQDAQVALNFGGLVLPGAGAVLEGNYIGTDATGTIGFVSNLATSNTTGIIGWNNAVIKDNLISGLGTGIQSNGSGVTMQGNYIGTDASHTQALPNGQGIDAGSNNLIGGTTSGAGNIIAFNDGPAIIANGSNAQIEGNSIFNNSGPAVSVGLGATGDAIEGNSIYGNGGPAIDNLAQYGDNIGPTLFDANWPGGPFTGTVPSQFPVTLTQNSSSLTFSGSVTGLLSSTRYMVYLWTTFLDGIYRGEYYTYVTTDANGDATFTQRFQTPSGFPTANGAYAQFFPPHSQGNDEQNFPVLNSATSGSSTIVSGTLNGQANTTFTVDVYATNPNVIGPNDFSQGQYYLGQVSVTTDANGPPDVNGKPSGNASFTADFSTANLPGGTLPDGWYISATATDPGGNTSEFSADVLSAAATQSFSQSLQSALPTTQNPNAPTAISIQTGPDLTEDAVISAVNGLTAPSVPVTITLNLNGGTYDDTTVSPPHNVTLIINGSNGTNTFVGNSPAFIVTGGNVIVQNVTFTTTTNAPTILVTGGNVTLLNDDIIQASTVYTQPAIAVTGGTVNLGTATTPGNNTLSVNSSGDLVSNTGGTPISAVGDTFVVGGTMETAPNLSFTTLTSSAATSILNQAVTLTATVQANGSTGTPTGSVDFFDTTTNTDLGHVSLSGGVAKLTTSALVAGNHMIVVKYGGDTNFLPSANTFTQSVQYHFSGFLPPLSNGLSFAVNRTIPIQFQLSDYNGKAITSLSAVSSLQIQALDAKGNPVGAPFAPVSTNKQGLQYSGGQYQFNWQTKSLSAGSYKIILTLADGTTQTKTIQLTAGGSSAGLVTDGSVGTATAGALLGGEVDLYVDTSNGDLTSDELARINDAVASIDAMIAPYGVTIVEVTDPTQANVTLNMNTTSSLGGAVQGVLGCTTDADQVTMIQGWNWYGGADPTQVGAGQFDFETAVVHELGHVLGLGHSSDNTSVMYATLAPGTANRTLVAADLNVPDDDSGSCALHAAPAATVSVTINSPSMTVPSSTGIPGSSDNPMSVADQLFANFTLVLNDMRNFYQRELSAVMAMWQSGNAVVMKHLDVLLRLEAGAMGISKDTLMRDRLHAS